MLFISGAAIFCLIILVLVERTRGARQLADVLTRLRSEGVELDPAKISTNSVPESENAAIPLLAITDELRAFSFPENLAPPFAMKITSPGEAASFIRAEEWTDHRGETKHWEQLREAHAGALEWFTNLVEISARPRFVSPFDISKGTADMEFRSLAALPAASRVLRTVAMCDPQFLELSACR